MYIPVSLFVNANHLYSLLVLSMPSYQPRSCYWISHMGSPLQSTVFEDAICFPRELLCFPIFLVGLWISYVLILFIYFTSCQCSKLNTFWQVSLLYISLTTVLFLFPPGLPVTGSNMSESRPFISIYYIYYLNLSPFVLTMIIIIDYCVVAFGIILSISTIQWFVDGRKNYSGPRVEVIARS